ncbi:hypothetical protein BH23GEM5_BH23GEM5_24070 [soil metagenome]
MSPNEPVSASYELLLAERTGPALPVPAPLDLVEIPFIRATYKLEDRDTDGNLPIEAYKIVHETTSLDGGRYRVTIQGSAEHGLPYGNDGDILVALFKLLDQHKLVDGLFPNPSVRMIADALGLPMTGQNAERIRGALARFAHVRFETRQIYRAEEVARAIMDGEDAAPTVPDSLVRRRGGKAASQEEVTWLLQYRWETSYDRSEEGEQRIRHLWVNPIWVSQAIAGWAAWIDTAVYGELSGPIARRLYQIMASFAARGRPGPWLFGMEALRAACAMSAGSEPKKVRDRLVKAGEALQQQGILARFDVQSPKKGQYRFTVEPGAVLEVASALRGVGLLDLHEVRLQLLLLNRFGVSSRVARQLVREQAHQVYWVLAYMVYREEIDEPADNPGGFIRRLVQDGYNPRGDDGFQRWYERRLNALSSPVEEDPPVRQIAMETGRKQDTPLAVEPLPDDTWGRARSRFREMVPAAVFESWLGDTWLESEAEDQVCVATPNAFAVEWIRNHYGAALESILAEQAGRPVRLVIHHRVPDPSRDHG